MTGRPGLESAPAAIREYLRRCGPGEELVAWWALAKPKDPHEALWVITLNRAGRIFTVSSFSVVVSHWGHQVYGSSYDPAEMGSQLEYGLWEAPEPVKETLRKVVESLSGP